MRTSYHHLRVRQISSDPAEAAERSSQIQSIQVVLHFFKTSKIIPSLISLTLG